MLLASRYVPGGGFTCRRVAIGAVATVAIPSSVEYKKPPPPHAPHHTLMRSCSLAPGPPTHVLTSIPSRRCVPIPPPPSVSPSLFRARGTPSRLASSHLPPAAVLCARAPLVVLVAVLQDGTALVWAARENHAPVARLLLERGALVGATNDVRELPADAVLRGT